MSNANDKALPLDGGGLGGGVVPLGKDAARSAPGGVCSQSIPRTDLYDRDTHASGAVQRGRRLRRAMTGSEKKLWEVLRKLGLGFRRQAPIGRYIVDFAQHSSRVVIEVDGGCHALPEVRMRDADRDAWLKSQGYRVLRVESETAYGDPWSVAEMVKSLIGGDAIRSVPDRGSAFASASTPPSPTLPPSRGKGDAR